MADALSMVYLPVNICDTRPFVENIDATMFLPGTAELLQQIRHATSEDPVLNEMIRAGWPGENELPAVQFYWVVESQLILKGHRLAIHACK